MYQKNEVSVILPVYNPDIACLDLCVNSVLSQKYLNWELIIVDDGSSSDIAERCDYYSEKSERITVKHIKNSGVSHARNIGLKIASGEYVMFIDADDQLQPNAIKRMYECAKAEKADIVQGGYLELGLKGDGKEVIARPRVVSGGGIKAVKKSILTTSNMHDKEFGAVRCVWGKIYDKKVTRNVTFNEKLQLLEDGLFTFNCLDNAEKMIFADFVVYGYTVSNKSVSKRLDDNQLQKYTNLINAVKEICDKDNDYVDEYWRIVSECLMAYIIRLTREKTVDIRRFSKSVKDISETEPYQSFILDSSRWGKSKKDKAVLKLVRDKQFKLLYSACKVKEVIGI